MKNLACVSAVALLVAPSITALPRAPWPGAMTIGGAQTCEPTWISTFGGPGSGFSNISALAVFDDGSGPALHAGGFFTIAGETRARVARWNGASWTPLGGEIVNAFRFALATFDDGSGSGPALIAGWLSSGGGGVARWDGASWVPLGAGVNDGVLGLAVFDDGGGQALIACGLFTSAGGAPANRIARWDGASWSPLGSGMNFSVESLAVFDDGSGPALYAGGGFVEAGGVPAMHIARWDGASWSPLGDGRNNAVTCMAVFDDGSGPALHAGSRFVAKWDGSSWETVGAINWFLDALAVFDDGAGEGPALYAGGAFSVAGGVAASSIARWNGTSWSALESGMNNTVQELLVFDDGSGAGPALYAAGEFTSSPAGDAYLARWQGCPDSEAPVLNCPDSMLVLDPTTGAPGEIVTFAVAASDRDPNAGVVCTPPSGSFFPRGTTLVTCTATDASGNQSSCAFPVTVQTRARRR